MVANKGMHQNLSRDIAEVILLAENAIDLSLFRRARVSSSQSGAGPVWLICCRIELNRIDLDIEGYEIA